MIDITIHAAWDDQHIGHSVLHAHGRISSAGPDVECQLQALLSDKAVQQGATKCRVEQDTCTTIIRSLLADSHKQGPSI